LGRKPLAMIFEHQDIICRYSNKPHNMSLRHGDTSVSLESRKIFFDSIGIPYNDLVCAKQVHSSRICKVTAVDLGKGALSYEAAICDTDALITGQRKVPLGILTADCLSIFMYEPQKKVAAVAHAGWRSTKELICKKTIKKMIDEFSIDLQKLLIGFGPSIKSCCYEVGEDFLHYFDYGLIQKEGKYFLDLVRINRKQLVDLGVKQENIADCEICTACPDSGYFSFRREGPDCGRMISVIMIK